MIKILFVCHGNICRSPMAEFVMKELVRRAGRESDFLIESAADQCAFFFHGNIPFSRRAARQITNADYDKYDYLVAMDDENVYYMNRWWAPDDEHKIVRLLSFAGKTRDIADPWYTGNFDQTYDDIMEGCTAFLKLLIS